MTTANKVCAECGATVFADAPEGVCSACLFREMAAVPVPDGRQLQHNRPRQHGLPSNIVGVSGKSGIRIDADDVTLDLAGFSMIGAGGSLSGILINNHFRIAIRNGSIAGWGSNGLDGTSGGASRLDDLRD